MSSINKLTVLGSGVMGHGIAQIAAIAGYDVALRDIEKSFLDRAMDKIKWSLAKMVEKKKLTQTEADRVFSRIIPMTDLQQAMKDTDLLIEAVPEDMDLKKKV
jgi:enoyl-CoA hydratase/3-hydroxyacyl-CoA dehydrogenase